MSDQVTARPVIVIEDSASAIRFDDTLTNYGVWTVQQLIDQMAARIAHLESVIVQNNTGGNNTGGNNTGGGTVTPPTQNFSDYLVQSPFIAAF